MSDLAGEVEFARNPGREVAQRGLLDRFVAFAFAAADLLVEASPDGIVGFAAGAFVARFGLPPEDFVGRHVSELIAPADRIGFGAAMAMTAAKGRSPAFLVRLAERRQTAMSVSTLLVPGPPARLCLTFGGVPAFGAAEGGGPAPLASGLGVVVDAAATRLRNDPLAPGRVGLLEVKGWAKACGMLPPDARSGLRADIGAALSAAIPGGLASELDEGRFGILAPEGLDLHAVIARLDLLLKASPAGRSTSVSGADLPLDAAGLAPTQAARALRFALTCFTEHGTAGAVAAGSGAGLSGIMEQAELRAVAMRQAIRDRGFQLRYQPVAALADRVVHHYEALLRPSRSSETTRGGTPQEYVAFAELVGLAEDLDAAVLAEALSALRASPSARIAVNMSGQSMQSDRFCGAALAAVADAGIGDRLMIELTETVEIGDLAAATSHMAGFRAAGIGLCLDDFGAGSASFRYLRQFPVDLVKIDGSYVRRAPDSPRDRQFVASIIDLANAACADTVAEMIETEAQAELMVSLGVKFGQGWLLGRPGLLPRSDI